MALLISGCATKPFAEDRIDYPTTCVFTDWPEESYTYEPDLIENYTMKPVRYYEE